VLKTTTTVEAVFDRGIRAGIGERIIKGDPARPFIVVVFTDFQHQRGR
jgi:hypothetical protein